MQLHPNHWIWKLERPEYHGGALREYDRHRDDNGLFNIKICIVKNSN